VCGLTKEVEMESPEVTLVEVWVGEKESGVETETWRVTETVHLRVPVNAEPELVAALVEAICAC
jgi:hypothetical protein